MKTGLRRSQQCYLTKVAAFLAAIALMAGAIGCAGAPTQYTLSISCTSGGTVTHPGLGTFTYPAGGVVLLQATPSPGYHFSQWTGDVGTIADVTSPTTTITMNGHYYITANFAYGELIRTWYDLDGVRNNLTSFYILANDLDSTTAGYMELASKAANEGQGWQPIGTRGNPFTGTFDGQGHEIRELFINRPWEEQPVGLFGQIGTEGGAGTVKNLGIADANVIGKSVVGALAGKIGEGTVTACYSTGSVKGVQFVGGLVGSNSKGTVTNCHTSVTVSGTGDCVGGLAGYNSGSVSNSHATGSVTGLNYVGGLLGCNYFYSTVTNCNAMGSVVGNGDYVGALVGGSHGHVSNSYATGNVIGDDCIGGLVGYLGYGTVTNCYARGTVTGGEYVGGLVGRGYYGTVDASYSSGYVTGGYPVGGLVGYKDNVIVNSSFWDIQTSGQTSSSGGTGKTTAQMKNVTTFLDAGWNIVVVTDPTMRNPSYIWNVVNGVTYPFLSWQPIP